MAAQSVAVFNEQMTTKELKRIYTPCLRPGKKSQQNPDVCYSPTCRVKFDIGQPGMTGNNGRPARYTQVHVVDAVDSAGNPTSYFNGCKDHITPNSHAVAIVEVGGVWTAMGKFGLSLICTHVMVFPTEDEPDAKRGFYV